MSAELGAKNRANLFSEKTIKAIPTRMRFVKYQCEQGGICAI